MKSLRKVFQRAREESRRPGRRVMGAFSDENAKASRHLEINVEKLLDKFDKIEFDISPNYYLKVGEGPAVRELGLVENMLITGIKNVINQRGEHVNYAEILKSTYEYNLLKELKVNNELNSLIFKDQKGEEHVLSYPEEGGVPIQIRGNILVVPNTEDLGDNLKAGWILVGINGEPFNDRNNIINAFKELLEDYKGNNIVSIKIIQSEEDIETGYNPLLTLAGGINTGTRRYRKRTHHKKSKKQHKKSKKQHKKSKTHRKRNNKKTHRKYYIDNK